MKITHGGVLLLVKLQAEVILLQGCFSRFFNCVHGTKSQKAPHVLKSNAGCNEFKSNKAVNL